MLRWFNLLIVHYKMTYKMDVVDFRPLASLKELHAIEADDDDVICPVCLRFLWHKSIEVGCPEALYCPRDLLFFSPEFPYQCLGELQK